MAASADHRKAGYPDSLASKGFPTILDTEVSPGASSDRDSTVGHADYSAIDFFEDVKCGCAREGIRFDDDIFNELVG
jgi:hypothetical protein